MAKRRTPEQQAAIDRGLELYKADIIRQLGLDNGKEIESIKDRISSPRLAEAVVPEAVAIPEQPPTPPVAPSPTSNTSNKTAETQSAQRSGGGGSRRSSGGGSASGLKFDAFSVLGLSESGYYSYVPITIRSAQIMGGGQEPGMEGLLIKLPLLPAKITDSVSVSFQRRFENSTVAMLAATLTDKLDIPDELKNIMMFTYDASTLKKEITVPFILPVTGIEGNVSQTESIRKGLTILQGMLYPRTAGLAYPPYVSLTIGGIYVRMKGFITNVSIEFDDTITDIGSSKFPLVVTGTIQFLCLQAFTWDNINLANVDALGPNGAQEFVLRDTCLLFGQPGGGGGSGGGGGWGSIPLPSRPPSKAFDGDLANLASPAEAITTLKDLPKEEILKNLAEQNILMGGAVNLGDLTGGAGNLDDLTGGLTESLGGLGGGLSELAGGLDSNLSSLTGGLSNIDFSKVAIPMDSFNELSSFQNALANDLSNFGNLSDLGINLNTDAIGSAVGNLANNLTSITTPESVANILNKLNTQNIMGQLGGVINSITSGISSDIGNTVNSLSNIVKGNINSLGSTISKNGIDVFKAHEFASDIKGSIDQINSAIESSAAGATIEANKLVNTCSYADNLRNNNAMKAVNTILEANKNILKTAKGNEATEIVSKIQTSVNGLLAADITFKTAEMQKQSSIALNELAQIGYLNKTLDYNTKIINENAMNTMSKITPTSMISNNNVVSAKMTGILDKLF